MGESVLSRISIVGPYWLPAHPQGFLLRDHLRANKPLHGQFILPEDSDYYYTFIYMTSRNVRYAYLVTIYGY
jgi:hypothetical protein